MCCCISSTKKCPLKTHFYTRWRRDLLSLGEVFFFSSFLISIAGLLLFPFLLFLLGNFFYPLPTKYIFDFFSAKNKRYIPHGLLLLNLKPGSLKAFQSPFLPHKHSNAALDDHCTLNAFSPDKHCVRRYYAIYYALI